MQESVLYRKDRKYNLDYIQVQIGIFFLNKLSVKF